MKIQNEDYKRDMVTVFYLCLWSALGILIFFILTRLVLPFVIAWLCALLFQPLINKFVGKRQGRVRKAASTAILIVVISLMLYFTVALINRGLSEIYRLADYFAENSDSIISYVTENGKKIAEKLHIDTDSDYLLDMAMTMLQNALTSLSAKLTSWAASFIMKLPGILFVTVIFVLAAFYISGDFENVNRYISELFPERAARKLRNMKSRILGTTIRYFRAYLILLCITFFELLVAFMILRIDYALLLAAVIAILDILPAIGVGTVLIPWAVFLLFRGETALGLSLLAVYVIITVIRQVAESHVIGSQLGISALATLFSVYVGFRLCGIIGMIIAPLAALVVKSFVEFYKNKSSDDKVEIKGQSRA